jgi:hypothetical protein
VDLRFYFKIETEVADKIAAPEHLGKAQKLLNHTYVAYFYT